MPKFFLAILPPDFISKEIIQIQKELGSLYLNDHSQKAPPHITIIPPFECDEEKLENFINSLPSFFLQKEYKDMSIQLNNYYFFDSRTLFIDVDRNESLIKLRREIKILFNQNRIIKGIEEKYDFLPHITIANKNINKREFIRLWESFRGRKFQASFTLKEMTLLKFEKDSWITYKIVL